MEKRVVELTKMNDGHRCLLCCKREATMKLRINRLLAYDDSVISFNVCDSCLSKMQQDIQKICE